MLHVHTPVREWMYFAKDVAINEVDKLVGRRSSTRLDVRNAVQEITTERDDF